MTYTRVTFLLVVLFLWTGCTTTPPPPEEIVEPEPLRPPVGIVRSTNLAERYLVFEAEFRIPEGTDLVLLKEGVPAGKLKAGRYRRRKFQVADVLEGYPTVGDLVEPALRVKPQPAQQGQSGGLRP